MKTRTRIALAAAIVLALLLAAAAQGQVPRVTYANPIAGFSLNLPDDWEMGSLIMGTVLIGIDADQSTGTPFTQPILWFFYSRQGPEATAQNLATVFRASGAGAVQPQPTANPGEWGMAFVVSSLRGPLQERWVVRQENGHTYALGALVAAQFAAAFQGDLDAAFASCHLIARPPLKRFLEPTENAYSMVLPADWQWEGQVFRSQGVPGYFVWKVHSPDGLSGAFSSPPGVFNIAMPYVPAAQAAQVLVLPGLQQQIPGARLEAVQDQPRAGAYYRDATRALGLGDNARIDKARADYVAEVNGVQVRIRVTIGTIMLSPSPLLGGRGDWFMTVSGAWAPADHFAELYPVGRGVIASLHTDRVWRRNQSNVAGAAAGWAEGVREALGDWFDEDYLRAQ